MKITREKLDQMVEEGWLISQVHPALDLTIYNYSQKTQYAGYWNEITLSARGLVMNSRGEIVARPFQKFFNAEEVKDQIPLNTFEVYEKMDGSLGIFFWYADEKSEKLQPVFASRGSFTSEQAVKGWEMLKRLPYHDLHFGYTHMFEIIYPENRIVVDYGDREALVLLGIIKTSDGTEVSRKNIEDHLGDSFELVNVYNLSESWVTLKSRNEPNREGYVLRFADGFRVKVKFEEYVRLHRIVTQVSSINIWEMLKSGGSLDEILERVPDEFFDWVREVETELTSSFNFIKASALEEYRLVCKRLPREGLTDKEYAKAFAERVADHRLKSMLFGLKNGRDIDEMIWKMLRPEWSKPFKNAEPSEG